MLGGTELMASALSICFTAPRCRSVSERALHQCRIPLDAKQLQSNTFLPFRTHQCWTWEHLPWVAVVVIWQNLLSINIWERQKNISMLQHIKTHSKYQKLDLQKYTASLELKPSPQKTHIKKKKKKYPSNEIRLCFYTLR